MIIEEVVGWDPLANKPIGLTDPIPDKPWLAWLITRITDRGRDVASVPALFVTHHALSRAAQRFRLRTAKHIVSITASVWHGICRNTAGKDTAAIDQWYRVPPQGRHIRIGDNITAVLRRHENKATLIVATFLWNGAP